MFAYFYKWNDDSGFFVPERVYLLLSYKQFSTIMQALKCFAIERENYDEVADAVNLVNDFKNRLELSKKKTLKRKK